jgi:hypothetical protein
MTYARGILEIIYNDSKFKNTKQLRDFIAKKIGASSTDAESMKMALMQYARDNSAKMMDLNVKIQQMAVPTTSYGRSSGGATSPSTNPFNFGWTGD